MLKWGSRKTEPHITFNINLANKNYANLDDTPTIEVITAADAVGADLVLIYDVSAQKIKAITITELQTEIDT